MHFVFNRECGRERLQITGLRKFWDQLIRVSSNGYFLLEDTRTEVKIKASFEMFSQ